MWHFILGKGRTTFIAGVLLSGALLWVLRGGANSSQIAAGTLSGVTVSRASNKTCATGATQDPAQLLVDPEFSSSGNWGPSGATFTAKAAAGPDGLVNAASLVTGASGSVISTSPASTPSAVPYTATVYAQLAAGSGAGFQLVMHDTGGSNPCSTSGTLTGTYQRFTCTGTAVAAGALQVYIQAPANSTIYIADAKLEVGSSATAYNFTGFNNQALVTLGSNTPCVEPNGLSVEGAATNLLLQSGDVSSFPTWAPSAGAVAAGGAAIAPDGTRKGAAITISTGSGGASQVTVQNLSSLSASTTYTFSVWLWAPSAGFQLKLGRTNTVTWSSASVSSVITLTTVPTRYSLTYTTAAGETSSGLTIGGEGKTPYSPTLGTFYAWGAQHETGSFPTSYIPTTGTSATRAGDALSTLNPLTGNVWSVSFDLTPAAWPTGTAASLIPFSLGATFSPNSAWVEVSSDTNLYLWVEDNGGATAYGYAARGFSTGTHHIAVSNNNGVRGMSVDGVPKTLTTGGAGTAVMGSQQAAVFLGSGSASVTSPVFGDVTNICIAKTATGCQ